ncbi:hypothetical protein [Actinomadura chokoriensis]|uniref:Uncharacterized protein n=1 Tax=Actinomadura chokoriensis TaxID=454156 RepID=A0ABV4R2V6_9ACTN
MALAVGREAGRSRFVLDLRTRMGHRTAMRRLELLRVALGPKGWRCVGLYDRPEFRWFPVPLLWVYASGPVRDVGAVVRARALPGGTWGYFEAGDERGGFVWPCEDTKAAADALDLLLKHRLFPGNERCGLR